MPVSRILLLLLLCSHLAASAMPAQFTQDSYEKSATSRQETCAECYEFESESICHRITLPGGIVQERTLDGLLYPESIKVKTPGQQTILSLANTFGKVQELKSQARSDLAGSSI